MRGLERRDGAKMRNALQRACGRNFIRYGTAIALTALVGAGCATLDDGAMSPGGGNDGGTAAGGSAGTAGTLGGGTSAGSGNNTAGSLTSGGAGSSSGGNATSGSAG